MHGDRQKMAKTIESSCSEVRRFDVELQSSRWFAKSLSTRKLPD